MKRSKTYILVGLIFISLTLDAQDINSPFSRFGLGQLYGQNISTQLQSMGGISLAVSDPYIIDMANPASYASFNSETMVFQTGILGGTKSLKNTLLSTSSNYATLSHVSIGFPVVKWWRMSLGATPYSKTGYNTQVSKTVEGYGNILNNRWGKGGLNRYYIGNGFRLGKNLRLGVNVNYLSGNISLYNLAYQPDSAFLLGTKVENYTRVSDFIYDWGLQYDIHFKGKKKLTIGLVYSNKINAKAYRSTLSTTLTGGYGTTPDKTYDTIQYNPDERGNIVIPEHYGGGLSYSDEGKWLIGADFQMQKWSKFAYFGTSESLQNDWKIAVGGEYTPNHSSISPLRKRITYRMGARYNRTYLYLNGSSISELAFSTGVKFPFKRSRTNINLGIEVGSRGTLKNNLIKETFFNFSFGINIVEHWFYKRKYR